ncbi:MULTISPECIES: 4-oxalocrotonate tautomerase family protein [unclassified Cyanobium]
MNVQITRGASRQQKAEIVRDITDSLQGSGSDGPRLCLAQAAMVACRV